MRIAVASNGLDVAEHFARCANFNYYTTKSCIIVDSQNMPAQGLECAEYAHLMSGIDVDVLVCDRIGPAARKAFEDLDIRVVDGAKGNALEAAQDYLDGKLTSDGATCIACCDKDLDD